jgi:hypothetical protein
VLFQIASLHNFVPILSAVVRNFLLLFSLLILSKFDDIFSTDHLEGFHSCRLILHFLDMDD